MTQMVFGVVLALGISMAMIIVRAIKGPTVFDRILAANAFGTKTVVLVAVLALIYGDAMVVDVALIYAIINFISTIAMLKYFETKNP